MKKLNIVLIGIEYVMRMVVSGIVMIGIMNVNMTIVKQDTTL